MKTTKVQEFILFALGKWFEEANKKITDKRLEVSISKKLFIGVHPDYVRRSDVEIQTGLVRPDVEIVYDLETLAGQVKDWVNPK